MTIEEVEELITGILYGGTAMTIGSCKRQANMITAALADRRYLANTSRDAAARNEVTNG